MTLRMAGEFGQAALDRLAGISGSVAWLDQHVAAVVAALAPREGDAGLEEQIDWPLAGSGAHRTGAPRGTGSQARDNLSLDALLHYACGFLEAAIGRGWRPSQRADGPVDWESMRLAAVCQLVSQAQAALPAHPDVQTSA